MMYNLLSSLRYEASTRFSSYGLRRELGLGFIIMFCFIWGCHPNLGGSSAGVKLNAPSIKPDFLENPPAGITIHPTPIERYKQIFYIGETQYFKIYFVETDHKIAFRVAEEIDVAYEKLVDWYQYQLITPYEMFFLPDKRTIYRVTGETRNLGGFVTNRRGTLFLASQHYNIQTVTHELSHIFLRKKIRERSVPRWFNEGLAEYLSTPHIDSEHTQNRLFSRLQNTDQLYTWQKMERYNMLRDARVMYAEALSIILFLNVQYGVDKLKTLLNLYADRGYHHSFIAAMNQVYGKSQRDLENEWRNFIAKYESDE